MLNENNPPRSTDICIIGAGIVGKYLYSKLKLKNNIELLSSVHDSYIGDSGYSIQKYLGVKDTWCEKATGIISYPDEEFLKTYPILENNFNRQKEQLKQELHIYNFAEKIAPSTYKYFDKISSHFNLSNTSFFDSSHDLTKIPSFKYENGYRDEWLKRRASWRFSTNTPTISGKAVKLQFNAGKATTIIYLDRQGNICTIKANKVILANHTIGSIALLHTSISEGDPALQKYLRKLGNHFSDHPQLSISTLSFDSRKKRDLPPVVSYSDERMKDLKYRIEINNTPPSYEFVKDSKKIHSRYSDADFLNYFMRLSVVVDMNSNLPTKLVLHGLKGYNTIRYSLKNFEDELNKIKSPLINHIKKTNLGDKDTRLLDNNFAWHFSGHMHGGICDKDLINKENLSLTFAPNVYVCTLATFPSVGLFNPTIPLLMTAKNLSEQL